MLNYSASRNCSPNPQEGTFDMPRLPRWASDSEYGVSEIYRHAESLKYPKTPRIRYVKLN